MRCAASMTHSSNPLFCVMHTLPLCSYHPRILHAYTSLHTLHTSNTMHCWPFSTSISIGGPHGAIACRYLVSIDDDLYEQVEMFRTILTTDVTITNDIAIATTLDDDGELCVQQLTQTHKASALISKYIYKGTTQFSHTAGFFSCLVL